MSWILYTSWTSATNSLVAVTQLASLKKLPSCIQSRDARFFHRVLSDFACLESAASGGRTECSHGKRMQN